MKHIKLINEFGPTKNTSSNKEIMDKVAIFEKWGYDDSYDFLSRHQSHIDLERYISDCMDEIKLMNGKGF